MHLLLESASYLVFKYIKKNNSYSIDENLTKIINDSSSWLSEGGKFKSVEEYISSLVSFESVKSITYAGSVLMKYGIEIRKIPCSVIILNAPENQSIDESMKNRTITFDTIKGVWLPTGEIQNDVASY